MGLVVGGKLLVLLCGVERDKGKKETLLLVSWHSRQVRCLTDPKR